MPIRTRRFSLRTRMAATGLCRRDGGALAVILAGFGDAPQAEQNFAPGGLAAPQHWLRRRLASEIAVPQLGQCMPQQSTVGSYIGIVVTTRR